MCFLRAERGCRRERTPLERCFLDAVQERLTRKVCRAGGSIRAVRGAGSSVGVRAEWAFVRCFIPTGRGLNAETTLTMGIGESFLHLSPPGPSTVVAPSYHLTSAEHSGLAHHPTIAHPSTPPPPPFLSLVRFPSQCCPTRSSLDGSTVPSPHSNFFFFKNPLCPFLLD